MAGLRNIAKAYGGMVINGEKCLCDYKLDRAVSPAEQRERAAKAKAKRNEAKARRKAEKAAQKSIELESRNAK
jgi:hypothetical protein